VIDPLLTPIQLAELLGVHRNSLRRLVASQRLPRPLRISHKVVRWKHSEIEEWLEKLAQKRR